jgi:hypothetical protein
MCIHACGPLSGLSKTYPYIGTGEYSEKSCTKKPLKIHHKITLPFSQTLDELRPILPGHINGQHFIDIGIPFQN